MKPADSTMFQKSRSLAGWALLIIGCTLIGSMLGNRLSRTDVSHEPIRLMADTAVKGETLSMATGLVSAEVEGLYVLDHASGLLQCWILNPRTGAVGGIFQANILADFGGGGKLGAGDFAMATGGFQFSGGVTGNLVPSSSVAYIADEVTGNIVGYSFSYNRTMLNSGEMQNGILTAVCKGPTRGAVTVERDQ